MAILLGKSAIAIDEDMAIVPAAASFASTKARCMRTHSIFMNSMILLVLGGSSSDISRGAVLIATRAWGKREKSRWTPKLQDQ